MSLSLIRFRLFPSIQPSILSVQVKPPLYHSIHVPQSISPNSSQNGNSHPPEVQRSRPSSRRQAYVTATCALILGSTTWASVAVMPSLIAAPISTYSILSVFDDLIVRSNKILPPVFILAGSSLGYLTYHTWEKGVNGGVRRSGWIYPAAMGASLALQTVIVPRNTQMEESVRKGEGKGDQGEERNRRIGELLGLNWTGWW